MVSQSSLLRSLQWAGGDELSGRWVESLCAQCTPRDSTNSASEHTQDITTVEDLPSIHIGAPLSAGKALAQVPDQQQEEQCGVSTGTSLTSLLTHHVDSVNQDLDDDSSDAWADPSPDWGMSGPLVKHLSLGMQAQPAAPVLQRQQLSEAAGSHGAGTLHAQSDAGVPGAELPDTAQPPSTLEPLQQPAQVADECGGGTLHEQSDADAPGAAQMVLTARRLLNSLTALIVNNILREKASRRDHAGGCRYKIAVGAMGLPQQGLVVGWTMPAPALVMLTATRQAWRWRSSLERRWPARSPGRMWP